MNVAGSIWIESDNLSKIIHAGGCGSGCSWVVYGIRIEAVCVGIVKKAMYRDNENAEAGGLNLRRVAGIRRLDAKRERPHRCWRSRNATTRVELQTLRKLPTLT